MGARGPKPKHTDVSCPNENCKLYALTGRGNVVSRGTYVTKGGDRVRKFACTRCGRVFNSRTGTAYEDLRSPQRDFEIAAKALCEGTGIRATGRVVGHTKDTIQKWNARCARQCAAVSGALEEDVDSSYLQFDEMMTVLKKNHRK